MHGLFGNSPTACWDYITTLVRCAARHDVSAKLRWALKATYNSTAGTEYMDKDREVLRVQVPPGPLAVCFPDRNSGHNFVELF